MKKYMLNALESRKRTIPRQLKAAMKTIRRAISDGQTLTYSDHDLMPEVKKELINLKYKVEKNYAGYRISWNHAK